MIWLKEGAQVVVKLGPFVDDTDGKTAETALTLANTDVRLSKNGGNFAASAEVNAGYTHDELGYYDVTLTSTDLTTLGSLIAAVHQAGSLPVRQEFMVVASETYDALVSGPTNYLPVNVVQISADSTAADNCELFFDGTGYDAANSTIGTCTAVTNEVTADAVKISGDTTAADNCELFFDGTGYAAANSTVGTVTLVGTTTDVTNAVTITANQDVNVAQISGDSAAADNLEAMLDGTGGTTLTTAITGNITGSLSGSVGSVGGNVDGSVGSVVTTVTANVTQISGDSAAANNLEAMLDGTGGVTLTTDITGDVTGNLSGSVGSVTGAVGSVTADVTISSGTGAGQLNISSGVVDANIEQINNSSFAAALMSNSALCIISSAVNDGSATTTSFVTDLTETTDDHYKGRIITFRTGDLYGQSSDITAYNGTTKAITCTALTDAPADNDAFVIT